MHRVIAHLATLLLLAASFGTATAQQKPAAQVPPVNREDLRGISDVDKILNEPIENDVYVFENVEIRASVGRKWLQETWFRKNSPMPFLAVMGERDIGTGKIESIVISWVQGEEKTDNPDRRFFYKGDLIYRELGKLYPAIYKYVSQPTANEIGEVGSQEKDGIVMPAFLPLTGEKKTDVEALLAIAKSGLILTMYGQKDRPDTVANITKIYTDKLRKEWQGAVPPPLPVIK